MAGIAEFILGSRFARTRGLNPPYSLGSRRRMQP